MGRLNGNTDLIAGFEEVYNQHMANPEKDIASLVFVLTDGSPNQFDKTTNRVIPQTQAMIEASKFRDLFDKSGSVKAQLSFVLFGDAARNQMTPKIQPKITPAIRNWFLSSFSYVLLPKTPKPRHLIYIILFTIITKSQIWNKDRLGAKPILRLLKFKIIQTQ